MLNLVRRVNKKPPNLLLNPTLTIDANADGVADGYTAANQSEPTAVYSIDGGQKIEITNSTANNSNARIDKTFSGLVAGTNLRARVDFKVSGDSRAWFWVDFFTTGWGYIDGYFPSEVTPANWTTYNFSNVTIPDTATRMIVHFGNRINTGQTGTVWIRNVKLTKK